jgi:hypothetical protein
MLGLDYGHPMEAQIKFFDVRDRQLKDDEELEWPLSSFVSPSTTTPAVPSHDRCLVQRQSSNYLRVV